MGIGPTPKPYRFQAFRVSLGKFVANGERTDLLRALGHYARTSTGGASIAPRRFGPMVKAARTLFDILSSLNENEVPLKEATSDLVLLEGADTDMVIQLIVQAATPTNGDADRIMVSLTRAMSEAMRDISNFHSSQCNENMRSEVMLTYVAVYLFEQILLDSRDAFIKASAARQSAYAESQLLEIITSAVDKHMRPFPVKLQRTLSGSEIEAAIMHGIFQIWREWETYR